MTLKARVYASSKGDREAATLLMKANEFNELMYLVVEDGSHKRGAYG